MADSVLVTVGTIKNWKTVLYGLFHTSRWLVKNCKDYHSLKHIAFRRWRLRVLDWECPGESGELYKLFCVLLPSSRVSWARLHWTTDRASMLPPDRAIPALHWKFWSRQQQCILISTPDLLLCTALDPLKSSHFYSVSKAIFFLIFLLLC